MLPTDAVVDEQPIVDEATAPVDETAVAEVPRLKDIQFAKDLAYIVDYFERQDMFFRERNLPRWKKGYYFWNNIQYIYWSTINHDYRTPQDLIDSNEADDLDPALYAKVLNIVKPHGEAIIAAMSAAVPTVRFFPEDADDHNDILTAKAYSKLSDIIQRHNKGSLLLMKALFLLYNEGLVFAYNENIQSKKFGSIENPVSKPVDFLNRQSYCPECGADVGSSMVQSPDEPPQNTQCQDCGYQGPAGFEDTPDQHEMFDHFETVNKTREIIEMYGPLHVKVPGYIRHLDASPYLTLETDEHFANLRETYPDDAEDIMPEGVSITQDGEMRIPTNYGSDSPLDRCRLRRCWLRPWAFNVLGLAKDDSEGRIKILKEKFPEGVYVVIVGNDLVVEAIPDEMDKHWTTTVNPLAESLHAEPMVSALIPIQEMTNELANLTLENIEFSIPETFADTDVVDFEAYSRGEARPGQMSPAKAPTGQTVASGFYEIKSSSLSQEVGLFADRLEKFGQFCVGSFPSIYGGTLEGGGGTAREYEQSRAQALQRLSTTWTMLKFFYADIMSKAVPSFAENMVTDERDVQTRGTSFTNVWVRQVELGGKVGRIEPEVSEAFPMSWSQKRDVILNLFQMKNPDVDAVIRHPENAGLIASILGVPELYIPGDDDRNKQLAEIAELIQTEPLGDGMPSVMIDPTLDNHEVEAETCKAWLKSEVGMEMKRSNPGAYANVMFHMMQHEQIVAQQQQAQAQADAAKQNPNDKSGDQNNADLSPV